MSVTKTARPASAPSAPMSITPAGHTDTLNGHPASDTQGPPAVEGQNSPQATLAPTTIRLAPAGTQAARSAKRGATSMFVPPAGHTNGRDQAVSDLHNARVPASGLPGAHKGGDNQVSAGAGDQTPPAAMRKTATTDTSLLADPLLALAADVLSDLEQVRIANENRLRQLTRTEEDSDGETRGFGLDESHPDVARLAALVDMLGDAEHKAALNLGRLMRKHPLGPWMAAQKGVGEKQGARLLAAIGDPYIRPEIVRENGTVEPSRPRMVSELWALCGYHVVPADQMRFGAHGRRVGGEQDGHPGQEGHGTNDQFAGVAPKRARGSKSNWSGAAKMRAYLVAESCLKQMDSPYRKVYDATREKYADAIHQTECVRCGPSGKPAQSGSPLSAGHQHARAMRAMAKEILRDLWREARRIHEDGAA